MRPQLYLQTWARGVAALLLLLCVASAAGAATLLPNGRQQFTNGNGLPLANGTVYMYTPGTSVCKNTWIDQAQSALNACPIVLDSNGTASIYGVGSYRQVVYGCSTPPTQCDSSTGVLLWDTLTTDTSASNSVFWAGQAGGTPNAITVNDVGFNATDGSVIQFIPLSSNTGPTTINPSGFGAISVVKDTQTGAVPLTSGEIVAGSPSTIVSVVYSASQGNFHILNLVNPVNPTTPQTLCGAIGLKITNDSGTPNSKADVTADQVTMITAGGQTLSRTSVSFVLNFTINGANGLDTGPFTASTWYNIWVIDNGSGAASLASLSSSAPTMPSGYNYKCRLGAMRADGSTNLFRTLQQGNRTQYVVSGGGTNVPALPALVTGANGTYSATTPTWFPVGISPWVPPTATRISMVVTGTYKNGTAAVVQIAPNNNYGGVLNAAGNIPFFDSTSSGGAQVPSSVFSLEMMLENTVNIYVTSTAAGGDVSISGWMDKVAAQ